MGGRPFHPEGVSWTRSRDGSCVAGAGLQARAQTGHIHGPLRVAAITQTRRELIASTNISPGQAGCQNHRPSELAHQRDEDEQATDDGRRPDPEVPKRARRRTFTAAYKQEILAAYDAAPDGEKGAILRREGLYSSLISEWLRARDAGRWPG
jgi:hypothetical protein